MSIAHILAQAGHESKVAAANGRVEPLHGQDVGPRHQQPAGVRDCESRHRRRFAHAGGGGRVVGRCSRRDIGAGDFNSIDPGDAAIIDGQVQVKAGDGARVREEERLAQEHAGVAVLHARQARAGKHAPGEEWRLGGRTGVEQRSGCVLPGRVVETELTPLCDRGGGFGTPAQKPPSRVGELKESRGPGSIERTAQPKAERNDAQPEGEACGWSLTHRWRVGLQVRLRHAKLRRRPALCKRLSFLNLRVLAQL